MINIARDAHLSTYHFAGIGIHRMSRVCFDEDCARRREISRRTKKGVPIIPRPLTPPQEIEIPDVRTSTRALSPAFGRVGVFPCGIYPGFLPAAAIRLESALGLGCLDGCFVSYPFRRMCLCKGRDNRHLGHYHVADMIGGGETVSSNNTNT